MHLAAGLKQISRPDFVLVAEQRGRPIGYAAAVYDANRVFATFRNGRLLPFNLFKLGRIGQVDRIKVLVNRVTAKQKPDLAGLESYLGVRPAGVFSDDTEALYETWSEGRMLDANAGLGKQRAALSKSLTDREAEDAVKTGDQTANAQAAGLGRLFSFMRRGKG